MLEKIKACGVVPVVSIADVEQAVPTARALLAGGIDVIEVTFRTEAAAEAIKRIAEEVPEMLVGAGTIINPESLREAKEAGARFIVSPGLSAELIEAAQTEDLPLFPGAITPSEIMLGLRYGLSVFKFFPASVSGGLAAIRALSGPFPQIKFMPTGGINPDNLGSYLEDERIFACGGSWMVKSDWLKEQTFEKITEAAKAARDLVKQYR